MGRYPGACAFRPDLPLPGMAGRRNADSTPICRCRVLYLGSAVPHVTKDGLQGIQEPLRELYPEQGAVGARGIDSWLSVWSNGVLLENVDENHKKVTRFFPIETLHYCAAVRYVLVPEKSPGTSAARPRFLPLDSPFARSPDPDHPPLFACILRRTTGIKVLECHAFICKREMAANALVRCCFHAYADSAYARHVDGGGTPAGGGGGYSVYGTVRTETRTPAGDRAGIEKVEGWRRAAAGSGLEGTPSPPPPPPPVGHVRDRSDSADDSSAYNGDENHKIWAGAGKEAVPGEEVIYGGEPEGTLSARRSRPRQTVSVPPPPPPPPQERLEKASKDKTANKKSKTKAREEIYWTGSRKAAGGARRPSRGAVGGGAATLPHPRGPVVVGPLVVSRYPPPRRAPREEPLYMPSDRPMSPLSSYQPCHFPHEAYLMRRYATADEPPDRRRERPRKETKRRSRRHEHDDRSEDGSDGEGDSLYDTGIYGRKGHLNERAFSYSIRQEHRSRSYGSLANLRQGNYGPGPTDRESKKEREIVQMMRHLELSPDDIERSQVPAALYRHPARTEDKFSRR